MHWLILLAAWLIISVPAGMFLGKFIRFGMREGHQVYPRQDNHDLKPCPKCNGEMVPLYKVMDRQVMACSDCGLMMPQDEYDQLMERRGG